MRLGTFLADRLAELVELQALDHARADHERNGQRSQRAHDCAHGQVVEDVEARFELREVLGEIEQHGQASLLTASGSRTASTTRSMRIERDPLTSTLTSADKSSCSASMSESREAYVRAP